MLKHSFTLLFVLLSLSLLVVPVWAFGGEEGFGAGSFDHVPTNPEGFFVHDTLAKLVFLVLFAVMALVISQKARFLRIPMLISSVIFLGFYLGGFLCPLTALQNLFIRYNTAFVLLLMVPTVMALFLGKVYCGYICPFGAIQELLQIKKWRKTIPPKYLRYGRFLKYILLVFLVAQILYTSQLFGVGFSPFRALFAFQGTHMAIVLTIIVAVLSLFIFRPFCQFLCPLGAFFGLVSKFNKSTILPKNCVGCNRCSPHCGMQAIAQGNIHVEECIRCGLCVDSCKISTRKSSDRLYTKKAG